MFPFLKQDDTSHDYTDTDFTNFGKEILSSPPPPTSSSSSDQSSSPPPPSPPDDNNDTSDESSSPPPPSPSDDSPPSPSDDNKDNSPSSSSSSSSSSSPPPPKSSSSSDDKNSKSSSPPPPPTNHDSSSWHTPPNTNTPVVDASPGSLSSGEGGPVRVNSRTMLIAGAAAGGGVLLILVILCCIACCRRRKRNKERQHMKYFIDNHNEGGYFASGGQQSGPWSAAAAPPPPPGMELHPGISIGGGFNQGTFTYADLAAATSGFSRENLLGQGGFGFVHKGILPNGMEVAVKSLKAGSGQGEREFKAEVEIINRVHHKHLVSLVGYCISDAQRMLVYEFLPNNSLEHHLYGKDRLVMDFPTRLKIALGSAKGFAYLHEDCYPRIIHRDIKAANILLDHNFEAKVADFGLAKLSNDTNTHVSTRIMGTFGYLAPEYAASGKLTEKSDVYSYGVVILELITGKRPIDLRGDSDDDSLVDWARPILMEVTEGGSYEQLVDPRLEDNYNREEMLRMVACAAACIRHSARKRPRMSQVVRALEGDANLEDLNEGMRSARGAMFGSSGSLDYDSHGSGVRRAKPRGSALLSSNEFTSSEHTSDFGTHASPSSSIDSHGSRKRTS